jgi:polar amino acid transport system substrate-binding protein
MKMLLRALTQSLSVPIFLAALIAVASVSTASAQSLLERAQKDGIRIALFNERPFAYMDENDQVTGSDIELARHVLTQMGITKIEPVVTQFESLISGLAAGRFDMIAAGLAIRPARCEQVLFTEPYLAHGEGLIVAAGNPMNIHSYTDIANNDEVILGYIPGGSERDHALSMGVPEERMTTYSDASAGVAGIKSGRIHGFAVPAMAIESMIKTAQDPAIERAKPFTGWVVDGKEVKNYPGMAFRKEDQEFYDTFNTHLKELIGTPEYFEIIAPFGFGESEAPTSNDPTMAELCAG